MLPGDRTCLIWMLRLFPSGKYSNGVHLEYTMRQNWDKGKKILYESRDVNWSSVVSRYDSSDFILYYYYFSATSWRI